MCIGKMTAIGWLFVTLGVVPVPASMAGNDPDSSVPSTGAVDPGSQVQGKGGGMGKSYQKNVPGPGKGYPESHGAGAVGSQGSAPAKAPAESVPGASDTEQAAEQQPLSRKARDGSGYGSGYPGERGLGVEGSPHHRQYGSQKPDPVAPADLEP